MSHAPLAGWPAEAPLVRAVGVVRSARIEPAADPANIDHVRLTIEAGLAGTIEVAINTLSLRDRDAGFDPRVRVGLKREPWIDLPEIGVTPLAHFSYAEKEARANFFYELPDRTSLEQLLIDSANNCLRTEVIGAPYHHRPFAGLHQIHSRRASCAVPEDLIGLDGMIRFYFAVPREVHWRFFKFCGQE